MTKPARNKVKELEDLPNIGKSIAADLRSIGIQRPAQLRGKNPRAMYEKVCRVTGERQDPCLLDVFISAVRYMEGSPLLPWWKFTAERKRNRPAARELRETK
ncbi:MAG TPA: helix-hairpin-helix domain-containing protein [Thermoanaerobaculia bacterium]|nr:helix-hairpin-helix domain-containing protein [Thermoanaerobaculia bacterium]